MKQTRSSTSGVLMLLAGAAAVGVAEGCSESPLDGYECLQPVPFLQVHTKWEGEAGRVRVAVDAPFTGAWLAMAFPEHAYKMEPATAAIATTDVAGYYVVNRSSGSGVVRDEQAGADLGLSDTVLTVIGDTTRMEFSFSTSILTNGAAYVNFAWNGELGTFSWHGVRGRMATFIRFDPSTSPAPPTAAPPTPVPTPVPERPPAPPVQDGGLWPTGQPVRYYLDTKSSVGGVRPFVGGGKGLGDLFQNETCVTFEQCEDEASCQRPYIAIVNGNSCDAPQGYPGPDSFAQVTTGLECSITSLVGRVLGLGYEQQRLDRDEFIEVDMAAVAPEQRHRFDIDASEAALGPYAYRSMMHPPAYGFANIRGQWTISSPEEIGFRGLMSTDVWRVNFLYCPRKAPRCVTSREEGVVHKVAVGQAWPVQFTALSGEGEELTVSFEETTAPKHLLTTMPAAGSSIGTYGRAVTTFTPTEGEVGKRFTLSALFSSSSSSSSSASCAVEVEVVAERCSGCSGHGVCQDSVVQPCVCDEGFAGRDCSGTPSCRDNIAASFDRVLDPWLRTQSEGATTVDHTRAAEGTSGSMRFVRGAQAVLKTRYFPRPPRISFYMASSKVAPDLFPKFTFGFNCIIVELRDTGIVLLSEPLVPWEVEAGRFYFFELRQADGFIRLFVDNQFVAQVEKEMCSGGQFLMEGDGWMDEFNVWCTEPSVPTTPAPPTSAPPTPALPTPAPPVSSNCPPSHPLEKCGRCWANAAQAASGGCL